MKAPFDFFVTLLQFSIDFNTQLLDKTFVMMLVVSEAIIDH